ncbi:hypothetical protein BC829DRAFT_379792 [Chytridium lagenaria]|nr:hypothetical protein BC829DRAFT_379792 [Chytridium lagenaria]
MFEGRAFSSKHHSTTIYIPTSVQSKGIEELTIDEIEERVARNEKLIGDGKTPLWSKLPDKGTKILTTTTLLKDRLSLLKLEPSQETNADIDVLSSVMRKMQLEKDMETEKVAVLQLEGSPMAAEAKAKLEATALSATAAPVRQLKFDLLRSLLLKVTIRRHKEEDESTDESDMEL